MKKLALAALLLACPAAYGQNAGIYPGQWSVLPGGSIGYTIDYAPFAQFTCDPEHAGLSGGTCAANGNSMTLTSSGGVLDLFFQNVGLTTVTVTTGLPAVQQIPLGVLHTRFTGTGPFYFPVSANGTQPLFSLAMGLSNGGGVRAGYISHGGTSVTHNCCNYYNGYVEFGTSGNRPPNGNYTDLVVYGFTEPDILADDEDIDITASVVLTPEPASLWLFVTGAVGVAGLRRRRAHRVSPNGRT